MSNGLILVAVDFEAASRQALELAKELARGLGAEVALAHVYALPVYSYPSLDPGVVPTVIAQVTDAAQRALDEFARSEGISRTVVRGGDTASEILAAARELGATMIAMGTHGRHGIVHALLGSIAERVARRSPIPVLTVRASEKK
jgi:nucleotide-binding universal stress UspA family protein